MSTLDELRQRFSQDQFAVSLAGAAIDTAEPGRAVCTMPLTPRHKNANGGVMGGAIFTLADFAFAVAANGFSPRTTVSQNASITFLAPARGSVLTAEAVCIRAGHTACLYTVDLRDDAGVHVAFVTINGFTVG